MFVQVDGRRRKAVRTFRFGGKRYYALDRISAGTERYEAFDPDAGPRGDRRLLQILPCNARSEQFVHVLQRISQNQTGFPHIIAYHRDGDRLAVVLSWIKGVNLASYLKRARTQRGPGITSLEAVRLFHQLAYGLVQLSQKANIVHGDIKPANLIVCREPNRLVPIDFGSGWAVERTTRRDHGDGSSEVYAAPETLRGEQNIDFRSDWFSAFVTFYEMLTFQVPYDGLGGMAGRDAPDDTPVVLAPPSGKCLTRKLLSKKAWEIVDAMTAKGLSLNPDTRFCNRNEWLGALDDLRYELQRSSRLDDGDLAIIRLMRWVHRLFPQKK